MPPPWYCISSVNFKSLKYIFILMVISSSLSFESSYLGSLDVQKTNINGSNSNKNFGYNNIILAI
jgi:hypothetical protein